MGQTVYSPKFNEIARDFALDGLTNEEIIQKLKISNGTFYNWLKDYPDFRAAIQDGKDRYDSENVEKAMKEDAVGKEFEEVVFERDPDGNMVESKRTRKWQRNFQAQRFWLMNRQPARWKESQEVVVSDKALVDRLALAEKRLQEMRNEQASEGRDTRRDQVAEEVGREERSSVVSRPIDPE